MASKPNFPIIVRDKADRSDLLVFESHVNAEEGLEIPDIEAEEYDAWDALGFRLSLTAHRAHAQHWLQVVVVGDRPELDGDSISALVTEYARLNGVDARRESEESVADYHARLQHAIEQRSWDNRPWWRRLFRIPNA